MNRKDSMLFTPGMTVFYNNTYDNTMDTGKVTEVEATEMAAGGYRVWAKWSDDMGVDTRGSYLVDFDSFVMKGDLKTSLEARQQCHNKLYEILNGWMDRCSYPELQRDIFNKIYEHVYDFKKVDAVKLLRESISISVQRRIVTEHSTDFAKYVQCDDHYTVKHSMLGLKEAKDIIDVMQLNM